MTSMHAHRIHARFGKTGGSLAAGTVGKEDYGPGRRELARSERVEL